MTLSGYKLAQHIAGTIIDFAMAGRYWYQSKSSSTLYTHKIGPILVWCNVCGRYTSFEINVGPFYLISGSTSDLEIRIKVGPIIYKKETRNAERTVSH